MAGEPARQVVRIALVFLVFVCTMVGIVECSRRHLERRVNHGSVVAQCSSFVSGNPSVRTLVGEPTNVTYQRTGTSLAWTPGRAEGRIAFLVQGTKSNNVLKVHWVQNEEGSVEVVRITMVRPWRDDATIWSNSNE